jgi:hypothetical protein
LKIQDIICENDLAFTSDIKDKRLSKWWQSVKLLMVRGEAFSLLLISALSFLSAEQPTGFSLLSTSAQLSRVLKNSIQLGSD